MSVARVTLRDQVDMLTNGLRCGEKIIRDLHAENADLRRQLEAALTKPNNPGPGLSGNSADLIILDEIAGEGAKSELSRI